MKYLTNSLAVSLRNLFPSRKNKINFLFLTIAASVISILELGIAKIFSEIVITNKTSEGKIAWLIFAFIFLSLSAKGAIFLQRTKRVNIFSEALGEEKGERNKNSWNLSLSMEFSNIISHLFQMLLILLFISFLSLKFGLVILIGIGISLIIFNQLLQSQENFQIKIFKTRFTKYSITSKHRVLARVRSSEIGSLLSGIISLLMIITLIIIHLQGMISTADTIVSFLAIRMLGTNMSSLSSSLMRYARALVYSSFGSAHLTQSSLADETFE